MYDSSILSCIHYKVTNLFPVCYFVKDKRIIVSSKSNAIQMLLLARTEREVLRRVVLE